MKIKPEKVTLSVDGKSILTRKLTKKRQNTVIFVEHSSITKQCSKGKSLEAAMTEYTAREIQAYLRAACDALDELLGQQKDEELIISPGIPDHVTYDDGEPVNLDDYEES